MSIPFIRTAQQKCLHCKGFGHNQNNCRQAASDCLIIQQRIDNILGIETNVHEERLLALFRTLKLHDLVIFMKGINGLQGYIQLLVITGKISQLESLIRYKEHRVKVLMHLYWYNSAKYQQLNKKLNIVAKGFEMETDLSDFECPICVDCKPGKEKTVSNCNHSVCKSCIVNYLDHQLTTVNFPKPRCALCRVDITSITFANNDYIKEVSNRYFKTVI